jgi:hypothetical protein
MSASATGETLTLKTFVAIALITGGIAAFAYQGLAMMIGGQDMSVDPVHMTTGHRYSIPLPPVFGAIALIGGIALLLVDKGDFKSTATP